MEQFDHWLFKKINGEWVNSFFDIFFPIIRQSNFWIPLYLFLLIMVLINFKKNWWWWIILYLCTVALTDLTGTYLFKHVVQRLRPCNDPDFFFKVRMILDACASGFSFISNHAANNFGMAAFVFFTVGKYFGKWFRIIWLWPIAVSYGQVYVGIHYPSDVLAGCILGLLIGSSTANIFNHRFSFNGSRIAIS